MWVYLASLIDFAHENEIGSYFRTIVIWKLSSFYTYEVLHANLRYWLFGCFFMIVCLHRFATRLYLNILVCFFLNFFNVWIIWICYFRQTQKYTYHIRYWIITFFGIRVLYDLFLFTTYTYIHMQTFLWIFNNETVKYYWKFMSTYEFPVTKKNEIR